MTTADCVLLANQFPYVTEGLDAFLDRQWSSSDLSEYIEQLRKQVLVDEISRFYIGFL